MGSQKYAVRVQADPDKLAARKIGLNEIDQAIQGWNVNLPTGTLFGAKQSYNLLRIETLKAMQTVSDAPACGHILMRAFHQFVSGGRHRSGRVPRSCVHLPDSPSPVPIRYGLHACFYRSKHSSQAAPHLLGSGNFVDSQRHPVYGPHSIPITRLSIAV